MISPSLNVKDYGLGIGYFEDIVVVFAMVGIEIASAVDVVASMVTRAPGLDRKAQTPDLLHIGNPHKYITRIINNPNLNRILLLLRVGGSRRVDGRGQQDDLAADVVHALYAEGAEEFY